MPGQPTSPADTPPTPPALTPHRVGLIADEDQTAELVAAIAASPHFALAAASGYPHLRELAEVEWFDDTRVMITQGAVDVLILATSTRDAIDHVENAAERNLPVWRAWPLGRSFGEATTYVAQAAKREHLVRVASWWEYVRDTVRPALQAVDDFKSRFSEIVVRGEGPALQSWRSGVIDAGGGVLTLDAYPMLEALVALRGLPDNVSAATGRFRKAPNQPPRETEDVATAVFRFEGGGVVNVRATWDIAPTEATTWHHGVEASVRLTPAQVETIDRDGKPLYAAELPQDFLAFELERFAGLIAGGHSDDINNKTLERHIAVTALLEAVYLSARTWAPELPRKFYEVQGWRLPRA